MLRTHLFGNKKGQQGFILSIMVISISLFLIGIMSFVALAVHLGVISGFTDAGLYSDEIKETGDKFTESLLLFDNVLVIMVGTSLVGLILTSYRLRASAAFFVLIFIIAPILGLISYFFNNVFIQFVGQPTFAGLLVFYPKTIIICTNLHWISLAAIVAGSIALYAKRQPEGSLEVR